ncbi:MAG: hypothetical protein ACK4SA_00210 [Caldilinea sp.]
MKQLIVHQVDITHYRLIELSRLADQAKPFYDWIEQRARLVTGSYRSLSDILQVATSQEIEETIRSCYQENDKSRPMLFDGIGRVYPHSKACFYFFAWMIRDAPQQRLAPLIARMQKADNVAKLDAEIDTLIALFHEYRYLVRSFEWEVVREIIMDRLEGSRRSISGHRIEAHVRTSLATAIQYYFAVHGNYGLYKRVEIADKQVKIGGHTVDVSVVLVPHGGNRLVRLLIPVKTRETEGGGHSHLFTRDLITAIAGLDDSSEVLRVAVVIIARNWSPSEIDTMSTKIDTIFHFDMSPNEFFGFDEDSQVRLNRYIASILGGSDGT